MPESNPSSLDLALTSWRQALGKDAVLTGEDCDRYGRNCIAVARRISAVVCPCTEAEVEIVVKIARDQKIPLYPISTGHNWGYGSAAPAADDSVIVDLSRMNRVLEVDPVLGVVTLEPGVTQQQLRDYLDQHQLPFLVPVTGAGPTCSLLGNALERGYGITPHGDHFAAVMALRAVLPSGEIYQSAIAEAGGKDVDHAYKWGVGPYLDGIFTQSSLGIVTQMTLALARVPERVELFIFGLPEEADLESGVDAVRALRQSLGDGLGAINILNRLRVLSMIEPYPLEAAAQGKVIPGDMIEAMAKRRRLPYWFGVGALYGTKETVPAMRRRVKKTLGPRSKGLLFFSKSRLGLLQALMSLVPGTLGQVMQERLRTLDETLDILLGRPRETALKLAYWKSGGVPSARDPDEPLDPARDGCGIMWYAPLVPMTARSVRSYVDMITEICPKFGINPLITLTTISERCFDSTVPILFDLQTEGEQAQACYRALFEEGQRRGFLPYRMNLKSMGLYVDRENSVYWRTVERVKQALDPNQLFSPGRYHRGVVPEAALNAAESEMDNE
ncbi:FAD-binding oxidoreductase [Denitrobaculum tricleocarpae]|uniref:FAD-binding oxidoreductase n=1 Tax=Denitrobaculum tricleocarpae TaxID=2591009 RepID=A0A545TG89_9PROT|nr:FAD-binding oxidoreductase [Denitrobaculum tricleocarpae]TQV76233.1 FAD-binding oxidoreductase [Denitrobaculum tricleocarpae]